METPMTSTIRHVDGGIGTRLFMGRFMKHMNGKISFEEHRRFKKDMQIENDTPTQRETPMTSKTRHVEGGVGARLFI